MRKVVRGLLLALAVIVGPGCTGEAPAATRAHGKREEIRLLKDRSSGYAASAADWQSFLDCWFAEASRKANLDGSRQVVTVLSKYAHLSASKQPSGTEVEGGIARAESRLRVELPKSYKDFIRVYRPPFYQPHNAPGGGTLRVGMYGLDQIGRLGDLEPQLARIADELGIESGDADYYVYGTDQDDVAIRSRYRRGAIVVGSHGPEIHDLIVLYPQEKTRDGEMEAALIFHSGEFRAPSFAELMRHLNYMETRPVKRVPPYSQMDLANACSRLLPLTDVWWK